MRHVSEAIGTGGRLGTVEAVPPSYKHALRIPGLKGDGVTPEEMIAGAWVACFGMTFIDRARQRDVDASEARYRARVTLESEQDNYTITEASLEVSAPDIEPEALDELIRESHSRCPVSKLLSGAVPPALRVTPAEREIQTIEE